MSPEPRTIRVSELLGRAVHDRDGRPLGRVADLITERTPDGAERVVRAYVVNHRWGRLLGYERDETTGPWLLEALARRILRRNTTVVRFEDLDRDGP